jgi:hypothetical protein
MDWSKARIAHEVNFSKLSRLLGTLSENEAMQVFRWFKVLLGATRAQPSSIGGKPSGNAASEPTEASRAREAAGVSPSSPPIDEDRILRPGEVLFAVPPPEPTPITHPDPNIIWVGSLFLPELRSGIRHALMRMPPDMVVASLPHQTSTMRVLVKRELARMHNMPRRGPGAG